MKFYVTRKTGELATSLSQSIGFWKQIALATTFGLATAILKDFFHLWSVDLIQIVLQRECPVCTFHISSSHKTIATDAYEDF